jgi:hypothetical protein
MGAQAIPRRDWTGWRSKESVFGTRIRSRFVLNDLAFVKLKNAIGQAWRARSEYLLTAEPRLVELEKMVKERKKSVETHLHISVLLRHRIDATVGCSVFHEN